MMRIWSSVNSYMFDERHLELLASLAEMHLDPSVSAPRRVDEIPDDARLDEEGHPETGPRPQWPREVHPAPLNPARMFASDRFKRHEAGTKPMNIKPAMTPDGHESWRGIFKDIGIFTQEEWDLIMCKCLTSMGRSFIRCSHNLLTNA
jgi:proteasome activator subunit 4